MDDDLNRMSATFSTMIVQRSRELQAQINRFSDALERFSARVSETVSQVAASLPSGPPAAPAAAGGILLVRVVNNAGQPIPVQVAGAAPAQQQRQSGGGFFASLLGGLGSFFGGIFSGFFAPVTGAIVGGELVAAVATAIPLVIEARKLVADVRSFADMLVKAIQGLIHDLFDLLTEAGIFPVSKLIASLLVLIDAGIRLILTYIQPLLDWVGALLEALADYLGRFVNALSTWLEGVLNVLPDFLAKLVGFILQTVVRPALKVITSELISTIVEKLFGALLGPAFALGNIIIEAGRWVGEFLANRIAELLNKIPGALLAGALTIGAVIVESGKWVGEFLANRIAELLNKIPGVSVPVPAAPGDLGPRIGKAVGEAIKQGQAMGRDLAEALIGPVPPPPGDFGLRLANAAEAGLKLGQALGKTAAEALVGPGLGASKEAVGPATAPTLTFPRIPAPKLTRPVYQPLGPAAPEDILRQTGKRPAAPGQAPAPGVAPPEAPPAGLIINGGISVQITAQTVSRDNAEATARAIAEHIADELRRITERERFRLGLATGPVG